MASYAGELTVTKIRIAKQGFLASLRFWEVKSIWKVHTAFRYIYGSGPDDYIEVPVGFTTDFASVPRFLWPIFPPDGEYTQAAVMHDYLYRTHLRTRKEADFIFLEFMGMLEVPRWKAETMYKAVRLFGQGPYDKGFKQGE